MRIYPKIKRGIDFILALAGLLVIWPLLVLLAVIVKVLSPGPIVYRGKRKTRHGKIFTQYKFRSMIVDARKKEKRGIGTDKLITPIGRILRMIHFDEWLQLVNILKGEMSFVGPRPYEYDSRKETEEFKIRNSVKGGIVSLSNLDSYLPKKPNLFNLLFPKITRGQTDLDMDVYYAENYSFWVDLRIFIGGLLVPLFGLWGTLHEKKN